ncbi:MAG TPA: hypothetical protein VGB30_06125 [bacterium]|jgi:hypothetical protein
MFDGATGFDPGPEVDQPSASEGGFLSEFDTNGNYQEVLTWQTLSGGMFAIGDIDFDQRGTELSEADSANGSTSILEQERISMIRRTRSAMHS